MKARQLVHRGEVSAVGMLVDPHKRHRVLDAWTPGDQVLEVENALVHRFGTPRAIRSDTAAGAVLVEIGGRVCAAPLAPDERGGEPGTILTVRAGKVVDLGAGTPIDPATWISIALPTRSVESLGAPPRAPAAAPSARPARSVFDIPKTGLNAEEVVGALAAGPAAPSTVVSALSWTRSTVRTLLRALDAMAATSDGRGRRRRAGDGEGTEVARGHKAGLLRRLDAWLSDRLTQVGMRDLFSGPQNAYLADLMSRFESGDLAEALRRAIPIDGEGGMAQALGTLRAPSPRDTLSFSPRSRIGSVIGMSEQLLDQMREMYQIALRRLEVEGRHKEAAFVLGELLHKPEEAVALLERAGLWAEAAELAEAKELDGALIVRLWFKAGEVDRAVLVARRTASFAAAVSKLDDDEARGLRLAWAATLIAIGDYGAAVSVLRDVQGAAHIMAPILDRAIAAGGPMGAASLAIALSGQPERWSHWFELAAPYLEHPADAVHLARGLRGEGPEATALRRKLCRALLAMPHRTPTMVSAIADVKRAAGGALKAEYLSVQPHPTQALVDHAMAHRLRGRGTSAVHGAVLLPQGRFVVARGEAGAEMWSASGELVRRWAHPSHAVVANQQGTRAVAMARRGSLWRLCKLDLLSGKATPWCDAELDHFSPVLRDPWVVARGNEVFAVDTSSAQWRSVWRLSFETAVRALWADDAHFGFHAEDERWRYEHPLMVLRQRRPYELDKHLGQSDALFEIAPDDSVAAAVQTHQGWSWSVEGQGIAAPIGRERPLKLQNNDTFWALALPGAVQVVRRSDQARRLSVRMDGGTPGLLLGSDELVVWDDTGRLAAFSLDSGIVLADLRV